MKQEEDILQRKVESYLAERNIRYIHIPKRLQRYLWAKGPRSIPAHIAKEASKAFKGVPDNLIFHGDKVLIMELKSANGRLTDEQKGWIEHGMIVCRTFEDAKQKIDEFVL